jgi:xylose dehydrogenase (NAD/NADP)
MTHRISLRWGLLGTARINQAVIGPILSSKHSQLMAVASRNLDRAKEYAHANHIPRYFDSYEALVNDSEIDVIYNGLPNSLHTPWSIKAMEAGKHVLCEKPLSTSTNDADKIIQVAKQTGMVIAEAFMYRHHPQTLYIKKIIDEGEIGELQLINGSFCYTNTRPNNIRLDAALGGGSLWDVGCYPISYSRFITGEEPCEVSGNQIIGPTGIDLLFAGQLRFPGGVIAQFNCSFISPYKTFVEITGNKGRIIINEPFKPGKKTKIMLDKDQHTEKISITGAELYRGEIEDLENAILSGLPTRISLQDSRENIKTIEALYQSALLSTPVNISANRIRTSE